MTDIPGAHNRLWHPELAKRDAEAEKVKPKCDRAHECESGACCVAPSITKCPYGYGEASE